MRIGLILAQHNPNVDQPSHFVSKNLAAALLVERQYKGTVLIYTAVRVSNKLIWLQTEESITSIKDRHKKTRLATRPIPRILPPRQPETLLLQYPHPEETSVLKPFQAFRRLCDEAMIQQQGCLKDQS